MKIQIVQEEAQLFISKWAETHYQYTGDEILLAYRKAGGPEGDAGRSHRLNWGQAMLAAESKGVHEVIGRVKPRSSHSHIASTCLRQSRIFVGTPPDVPETAKHYVSQLRSKVAQRKITLKYALWAAYAYGVEEFS